MSQSKSGGSQTNKQSDNLSEQDLAKQRAGKADKSSHDHMSRQKAGKDEGAGGGAKQKARR
ncbi:hypothetical protein LQ564_07830 [Massilia sp. G4R7]|uniref:Stress-induced protein n=1 Tax=Massilia phyllostachyos TaxID=2898585 RepID=A0ABS8Q3A9_9BURK|nr:hypothetical protein [Massilia phyllostachyos]MCD2516224.1 hypothetical protein [Massilia phyllostachyos]